VLAGIATVLALLYWLQARSLIMRSKLSDEKLISQKAELEDNQQKLEALKKEREITNGLNQSIIQAQEDLYTLKLDKAKEEYNSLLQQFGENNTAKAVVYSNLGEVYFQNSQPPEALDAYNSALSIWKEGKNAAFIYNEQAEVYMDWADQTANSTRAAQYYVWAKTLYNKAQRSAKAGTPIYRAAIRGAKEAGDKANPSANPFAQTNPQ
jgi:tetratricopeptide (TPR) repeat protein